MAVISKCDLCKKCMPGMVHEWTLAQKDPARESVNRMNGTIDGIPRLNDVCTVCIADIRAVLNETLTSKIKELYVKE